MQQRKPSLPTLIFCVAAPSDRAFLAQWETHLLPLQQAGQITVWSEQHLMAGTPRTQQLYEYLNQAQVIIFLLSAEFFASSECVALVERALECRTCVIPLLLRPVAWQQSLLASLVCLPPNGLPVMSWDNLEEAFHACCQELLRILSQGQSALSPAISQQAHASVTPNRPPLGKMINTLNHQTFKVFHNLPPQYGDFLGRETDLARVLEGLSSRWPLVSIEGLAGIGKTRLAVEAAHCSISGPKTIIDEPFEVAVWVSASDRPEQKRWINEVLDTVARVLGYPYIVQTALENKPIEVDHLLRNHRALVIVDNFETIDDPDLLNWIQRVPEPSKALITTRHHNLRRVWDIHLKGLGNKEALELIRRNAQRLSLQSIQTASEELLLPLAKVAEGIPRIIEMALGYVKAGRLSLREVVDHLYKASKTVDNIFDYLFSRAWRLMTRDAREILLVMPFFSDSASKEALGATTNLSGYNLDVAIEQLVDLALLDINEEFAVSSQRYSTHPLTRAFASSKQQEEKTFIEETRLRWSKYYVEYAAQHIMRGRTTEPYWNVLTSDEYVELDIEWPNVQNVLPWLSKQKLDEMLLEIILLLAHYMGRRLLYHERITYARLAAEAADRLNRKKDEACLRIDALGYILIEDGKLTEAMREISTGIQIAQDALAESSHRTDLIALGHAFLARVFLEQGDITEAAAIIEKVIDFKCTPLIQCRVNMIAGDVAIRKNNYRGAISLYEAATQITLEEVDTDFDALLRYRLGTAYLVTMELARAEEEFKKVPEQRGMNILVMYTEYGLARVALARGNKEQARYLAQTIVEKLRRFTNSHQLFRLVESFLDSLD